MPKTAVSPNFEAHQLVTMEQNFICKYLIIFLVKFFFFFGSFISVIFVILPRQNQTDEPQN